MAPGGDLEQVNELVQDNGQDGGQGAAEDHGRMVQRLQALEDIVAQAAAADRRDVYESLDRMLTPTSAGGRNWRSSMGQDVTKGRPTEIDYMNGHVVAKGRERGVPTPVSAAGVLVSCLTLNFCALTA